MRLRNLFHAYDDVEDAERFYGRDLGLPILRRGRRSVQVDLGGVPLHLNPALSPEEQREWSLPPGAAVVSLQVADLEAAHARLLRAGRQVLVPPRDAPWGGRLLLVRDPAGHVLELTESP